MTTGSARKLAAQLAATQPEYDNADEAAAIAFTKRLQERGIVGDVAGMPDPVDPDREWRERVLAYFRDMQELERRAGELRKAEASPAPQTAAGLLAAALAQANQAPSQHMPLNGAAVLRAALAGGSGTIKASG
ncbi:hypothetical protein [Mycobacterium noviomagense]|uniref:Uncharacterized protein n=1 Tax=Mycobacterium noviomagense TaxID=459858 RepID=A0A7I7PBV0_9MYCO|nr:hypothetical protein [Mycobacterium noviomagense]ORB11631.1 hypothetical protein BST37_18690 [Mycobacterium noviomagense]BBY06016.1 hypothetical protein MNVI_13340 [Mycobacterium noviomagense]